MLKPSYYPHQYNITNLIFVCLFYVTGYNSYLPNFQTESENWYVKSQVLRALPQKKILLTISPKFTYYTFIGLWNKNYYMYDSVILLLHSSNRLKIFLCIYMLPFLFLEFFKNFICSGEYRIYKWISENTFNFYFVV